MNGLSNIERDAAELRGILRASGYFDPGSRAFLLVNALESAGRSFEVQTANPSGAVSDLDKARRLLANAQPGGRLVHEDQRQWWDETTVLLDRLGRQS